VGLGLDGDRWGVPVPWSGGRHARRARIAEMIDLVDATSYATRSIGDVSGGEQQRLLIAQALVRDPALLLLDEPLDSLDLPSQAAIAALLARLSRERGMTIVLVAHDVNPLLGYLDQVVYLGRGHAMSGPPADVVTSESLTRLYGTPVEVLRASDGRSVVVGQPEAPAVHTDRHGAAPHHHGH
jgi:zinc/manganese transport system ATP-binding protein